MKTYALKKLRLFILTICAVSLVTIISACGGGGDYEAPESKDDKAWWDTYETSAESVISASTAADWITNGYKTDDGDPVVILDVQTDFSDSEADRIIASTSVSDIETYTVREARAEGPIDTTLQGAVSSRMVPSGPTVDSIIQDLGVTKDTVIVLTSSKSGYGVWNLTRGWWMLYYWGFAEDKIRVIDGGVAAVKAANSALVDTASESVDPADSTFSVKELPCIHDIARVSTKQVIDYVKTGSAKIIDARGGSATSREATQGRITGAIVAGDAGIAGGSLVNEDGTFKSKEEMEPVFASAGISSSDRIIVHCYSGYSATPIYFYIKEVLGYDNVALYDGSWSAWASHVAYTPMNDQYIAGDNSTAITWGGTSFVEVESGDAVSTADVVLGGPLQADANPNMLAYDTAKLSDFLFNPTSTWKDEYGVVLYDVDTDYTSSGTEIAEEDAAYLASDDVDSDDSDSDTDDTTEPVQPGPDTGGC
ncbi:sulfurtransferase [Limisalsivibrio acetivorans]|uniref:sulfurtransferase n=1 Tax=Limisalsivibrio acetivorans TaxID=1304888 RepID=UPI0003B574FA|nr:rhodanese-like domain-containing protein [Limisalsivibrio acetivorans]